MASTRPSACERPGEDAATMSALGKQWRSLSPRSKQRYQEIASEMSQDRASIAKHGLDRTGEVKIDQAKLSSLSKAQKKRVNHARMDITLRKFAGHQAWKSGLGLGDHMFPLRASLVDEDLSPPDAAAEVEKFFGYDRTVVQNTVTSADWQRPCGPLCGGVCSRSKCFFLVKHCVSQLQVHLKLAKLHAVVTLLRFEIFARLGADREESEHIGHWCLLGCTTYRPLSHVLHKLYPEQEFSLRFTMKDGKPDILTSHRLIESLAHWHEITSQSWSPSSIRFNVACLPLTLMCERFDGNECCARVTTKMPRMI